MPARLRKFAAILCTVALLLAAALPAAAGNNNNAGTERTNSMPPVADALFMRPLGFLTLAAGVVLVIPASLITLMTRPQDIAAPIESLIVRPAKYIWVDPLGSH